MKCGDLVMVYVFPVELAGTGQLPIRSAPSGAIMRGVIYER